MDWSTFAVILSVAGLVCAVLAILFYPKGREPSAGTHLGVRLRGMCDRFVCDSTLRGLT
jgi:hypothetical protein